MKYTNEQLRQYYLHQNVFNRIIEGDIRKDKDVVYGSRAFNAQAPKYLQRPTTDYDIYASGARQDARQVEKMLDRAYRQNYFRTEQAKHPGTYKVLSNVTGETLADYTNKPTHLPYVIKRGIRYVPLNYLQSKAHKTLKDPYSEYRYDKEKDTLQRIKLIKK